MNALAQLNSKQQGRGVLMINRGNYQVTVEKSTHQSFL
jgi:hypothetical protein